MCVCVCGGGGGGGGAGKVAYHNEEIEGERGIEEGWGGGGVHCILSRIGFKLGKSNSLNSQVRVTKIIIDSNCDSHVKLK